MTEPNITPEGIKAALEGVTDGPWTLCAHLRLPNEADCPCRYRGVIYAGETEYAICQPGHDSTKGEEGLDPLRLPRDQEIANARFIAWARDAVPAMVARMAADQARIAELSAQRDAALAQLATAREDAIRKMDALQAAYLSPQYAVGQPISSAGERFAVQRCKEIVLALLTPPATANGKDETE